MSPRAQAAFVAGLVTVYAAWRFLSPVAGHYIAIGAGFFIVASFLSFLTRARVDPHVLNVAVARQVPFQFGGETIDTKLTWVPWFGNLLSVIKTLPYNYDILFSIARANDFQPLSIGYPVGSPDTIFTDELAAEALFSKPTFEKYSKGAKFHNIMTDLLGDGIFNVDGERWLRQRKAASNVFSRRFIREVMHPVFKRLAVKLVDRLDRALGRARPEDGVQIDMGDLFYRFTLDSFVEVAFGVRLGCVVEQGPVEFASAFDRIQAGLSRRFLNPAWPLLKALGMGSEKQMKRDVNAVNKLIYKVVRERRRKADGVDAAGNGERCADVGSQHATQSVKTPQKDLISYFLADAKRRGETLTDAYLRDVVANFIIAGRDTTAVTLSWLFLELARHPNVLVKVLAEIRAVCRPRAGDAKQPFGEDDIPDAKVIGELRYLHAAISETLRLHPPVPIEVVQANQDTFVHTSWAKRNGKSPTRVHKGSTAVLNIYGMGRNTHIWGPDAARYRPERWLDKRPSQYEFVSFKAGPRVCLGQRVAYLEAQTLASVLLSRYQFALMADPAAVVYEVSITLAMKNPLIFQVKRRAAPVAKAG